MPSYQQCLIFRVVEKGDQPDCQQLENAPTSSQESQTSSSARGVKYFALLPQTYLEEHPDLRTRMQQNNVHIFDEQNVASLLVDEDYVFAFEMILRDSPSPPSELLPAETDADEIIRRVFPNALKNRTVLGLGSEVLPAVDDANSTAVKLLSAFRPSYRISFVTRPSLGHRVRGGFLHLSACRGHLEVARMLLDNGLDVNSKDEEGFTALLFAVHMHGDTDVILLLVDHGADVNAKGPNDGTPLHLARDSETVELLLQNGADLTSVNSAGRTPILEAVYNRCNDVIEACLDHGDRVYARNADNLSVLDSAFRESEANTSYEEIRYILERCFVNPKLLEDSLADPIRGFCRDLKDRYTLNDDSCYHILWQHVEKIATLHRHLDPNFGESDVARLKIVTGFSSRPWSPPAAFKHDCEMEIPRMKSLSIGETDVSFLEVLARNEYQVASLLRNESVAEVANSDRLWEQFPIYGNILSHHLHKGKLRKFIQEEGIKSCKVLSRYFKALPDAIQEKIMGYIGKLDVYLLKKAAVLPES